MLHINYSPCPSNLLWLYDLKEPPKRKTTISRCGISPTWVACVSWKHSGKDRNPSARTITAQHSQTSLTCQLKLFFTPDICVGFSILFVNWISDLPPSRFALCKNERHSLNPQTRLNPQHPRMNLLSCGAANCIFSFFAKLEDTMPIINKHEAKQFIFNIWGHYLYVFIYLIRIYLLFVK